MNSLLWMFRKYLSLRYGTPMEYTYVLVEVADDTRDIICTYEQGE